MTREEVEAIERATRTLSKGFRQLRLSIEEMAALWKSGEIEKVDATLRAKGEARLARYKDLIKRITPWMELYLSPSDG